MRRRQRGFTILELLVVVAIIGLLATIAVPRFAATKQRAFMASMMSDLKTLASAQEGFYSSYRDYAAGIALVEVPGPGAAGRAVLQPSPQNIITVTRQDGPNGSGWTATVVNGAVVDPAIDECGIYVGHASYSPNSAVVKEGVPACY